MFSDTDAPGPYLVTLTIEGELEDGETVTRQIVETFQVGPISQNELTASEVLEEVLWSILGSLLRPR